MTYAVYLLYGCHEVGRVVGEDGDSLLIQHKWRHGCFKKIPNKIPKTDVVVTVGQFWIAQILVGIMRGSLRPN